MNTNTDLKIQLGNNLLMHVVSSYQSSTLEFILAQYIMDSECAPSKDYTQLMQDFQGKCDELATAQVEMSELRNAYCKLQEQFNAVERALKGMRGDYEELKNSKAALRCDYDQLVAAISLKNSECVGKDKESPEVEEVIWANPPLKPTADTYPLVEEDETE